ncbi:MAG TPA: hypothetical protein VN033_08575 [Vulgatibacter sp.]|nr:hypothetical protein [Vulgatibacter sp.]
MSRTLPSLALGILLVSACTSAEDRAAKERIFSPEDPPRVLLAARERLDPARLPKDAALRERVFSMHAEEARARFGPHEQKVRVSFRWSDGEREVKLTEDRSVALAGRDDFHVVVENDERQGMEWVRVDGTSYTRSRWAKFRERRRDRGSSDHVVASAYSTLQTFHDLVHGAIRLDAAGEATVGGRRALRFDASLGEARAAAKDSTLPPPVYPKDGPDPDTALRLAAAKNARPVSLAGTIAVDAATAVPLEADLKATIEVPADAEGKGAATLDLSVRLDVAEGAPRVAVPEHMEDAPRPPGVVATLRAYGFGKEPPQADEPAEPPDEE